MHFASGDPTKAAALAQAHKANSGSYAEVVEHCPVLLYTIQNAKPHTLCPRGWSGKPVIHCNPPELPPGC